MKMHERISGYLEMDHTADWALKVWAPDLAGLVEQAALGMNTLSGLVLEDQRELARSLTLQGYDPEQLLVNFLSEVLFIGEEEGIGFSAYEIEVAGLNLDARMTGSKIAAQEKEIKAVTFHDLSIKKTTHGLETTIVFDV
jgi:SHS2 domain-containing protein